MKKNRIYDDDDGRTIADMSDIGRQPLFLPRLPENDRPWEQTGLTKEERLWYTLGALKAALLIALAFIGGLGLIVLLFALAG